MQLLLMHLEKVNIHFSQNKRSVPFVNKPYCFQKLACDVWTARVKECLEGLAGQLEAERIGCSLIGKPQAKV